MVKIGTVIPRCPAQFDFKDDWFGVFGSSETVFSGIPGVDVRITIFCDF
jgi:hypothetical protein